MTTKMINLILTLVVAVLALNAFMYLQQPAMIFFPYKQLDAYPTDWGLEYEDVQINTSDGISLHGWYIPKQGASHTLLFLHGNAGNISHRRESINIFHKLGLSILIVDYRGYGKSQGVPNEKGLYLDASAAWHYLIANRKLKAENIIIFGRSLGGAIATKLATQINPGHLILESTFSSARDMANRIMPVLSYAMLLRYQFNTVSEIKRVTCPVLVIHSPDDEIIPYRLGQKIYQAANEPKTFMEIRGDHNSGFILSQSVYEMGITNFIANQ